MNKLGTVRVGDSNPVRIMGILNTSPESFYKKSISITKQRIVDAVNKMEEEGAVTGAIIYKINKEYNPNQ